MLDKDGIVLVDTSRWFMLDFHIQQAARSWTSFCELPQEVKEQFRLPQFETNWADPGYFRKRRADGGYDEKEYLHFLEISEVLYGMQGMRCSKHPLSAVHWFLCSAGPLASGLRGFLLKNVKEVQRLCDDCAMSEAIIAEINESISLLQIRFLRYEPNDSGMVIGDPHVDKSGLTFHLYSSHPGLQYTRNYSVSKPESVEWTDLTLKSDYIAIFGGHQMNQLSDGLVKPLVHRVVQAEHRSPRYSMVAFLPFLSVPRFPRDKRVQEAMVELGYV